VIHVTQGLESAPEPASAAAPGKGDVRVLVVDDSAIDRRIAGGLLEREHHLVVAYASNGREALDAIDADPPAVVVTDMQMPELDGLGLVEEVRRRHPQIPVVLMTAYGSEEIALQALRSGAASYVPKRALARELLDTIRQVLRIASVGERRQRLLGCIRRRETALELTNDADLIPPLVDLLMEDFDAMDLCDATARMRVGVALQEAIANAAYHGNLEVSSDLRQDDERKFYALADSRRAIDPFRSRRIHVQILVDRDQARFVVRDEGPGFDTSRLGREIEPEDLMRIGGRGLLLIGAFMDEVAHNASGNAITMTKRRS
jgi:CheY-like chemotaxis protein/anti-sigma regulatory factor (Ser/Thr protein kinase)